MGVRDATIERERRDLVTHQVMDESRLIRFVAAPDGSVAPDLARKLPGRGLWVAADRASVEAAVKKNLFARAAKAPLKPAGDLADRVEALLARRCLELLGLARRYSVVIVPSADGTGTNALLRTPPDAIAPHFGPGSCRLHIEETERNGWDCVVVRPPGLLADIDTPEDVEAFLAMSRPGRTRTWLEEWTTARNKAPAWR